MLTAVSRLRVVFPSAWRVVAARPAVGPPKKADLWSVGCITFHLIAGEPPFECEDEVDTMRRLLAVSYFWPMGLKVSRYAYVYFCKHVLVARVLFWCVGCSVVSSVVGVHFRRDMGRNLTRVAPLSTGRVL